MRTWGGLQGHALVVIHISNPEQAHDVQVVRLGLLRQVGCLIEPSQHGGVLRQGIGDALRRLHQSPAAEQALISLSIIQVLSKCPE